MKKLYYQLFNGSLAERIDIEKAFYIATGKDALENEGEFLRFLNDCFGKSIKCAIPLGIEELIVYDRKIAAIKLYREEHKCSLVEAKNAVEEIANSMIH